MVLLLLKFSILDLRSEFSTIFHCYYLYLCYDADILLSDMTVEGVYVVTPEVKASMAATKKKKKKESRYDNLGPDLSFPRNRLTIEGDLGSGAFGKVLLGTATGIEQSTSRTKVAVKTLKGDWPLLWYK